MPPVEPRSGSPDGEQRELLNVDIPADGDAIGEVADQVSQILLGLGIPEEKQMEVSLALQEALANAVKHGCGGDPSKSVHCRLSTDDRSRLLIVVSDPGPGMDVNTVPDPKAEENLYRDHGRGIYLIRRLMDDVRFERGGREIRMWKY